MDGAEPQKNQENKFSLVSVIPLAMITTTEWIHGFPLISRDTYGGPSVGPRSSANDKLFYQGMKKVFFKISLGNHSWAV